MHTESDLLSRIVETAGAAIAKARGPHEKSGIAWYETNMPDAITPAEYRSFQQAYDFFNRELSLKETVTGVGDAAAPCGGSRVFLA